ncbi:hypothetical protein [Nostoc sp. XA010]|nr:hypothetical protein [Nostoc sp. XA010]
MLSKVRSFYSPSSKGYGTRTGIKKAGVGAAIAYRGACDRTFKFD